MCGAISSEREQQCSRAVHERHRHIPKATSITVSNRSEGTPTRREETRCSHVKRRCTNACYQQIKLARLPSNKNPRDVRPNIPHPNITRLIQPLPPPNPTVYRFLPCP